MSDYQNGQNGENNPYRTGQDGFYQPGDSRQPNWQTPGTQQPGTIPPEEAEKPYSYQFSDYETQSGASPDGKPPKKRKKGLVVFCSILGVVVAASLITFAGYGVHVMLTGNNFLYEERVQPDSSQAEPSPIEEEVSAPKMEIVTVPEEQRSHDGDVIDGGLSNEAIAAKVSPSTVRITIYNAESAYGIGGEGTGIVLTEDGYIVTNQHVIADASGITVTLNDNESYNAVLVGGDELTDLAVIKLQAEPMPKLVAAEFGDSDMLQLGERVIAIGNAGGSAFSGSVTGGMISGLNRQITNENGSTLTVLQTDAAINPGNSGGPLINRYGQVIGINSAKYTAEYFEGIGFAIPSNSAKPVVDDLIAHGRVTGRARLGVQFYNQAITASNGQYLGLPSDVSGLLVLNVDATCDIAKKGVVAGDVIMRMDGTSITSFSQLQNYIVGEKKPGDEITLDVYRPAAQMGMLGKTFTVTVTLNEDTGEDYFAQEETTTVPEKEEQSGGYGSFPFPLFPF